jgi:phage portal protein BeeE
VRLYQRLLPQRPEVESRFSLNDLVSQMEWVTFNGHQYPAMTWGQPSTNTESTGDDFNSYAESLYKRNGIIGACINIRLAVFSQTWPMWQRLASGRPGDLYSDQSLEILRTPWPNGTTAELLARMCQDADLAGNFFAHRDGPYLDRLRPDWVEIVLDGPSSDPASRVAGYAYRPSNDKKRAVFYPVAEVVHWSPLPDPTARYRGMSWLTPVVREVLADGKMTQHKAKFLDNAATPNLVVKYPELSDEQFEQVQKIIDTGHTGVANAYKTLHLVGGADVTVVGQNFQQLDFKVVQGAGETRIAAAAGVPPVIVGFSEGLAGSSLNAGNYGQARRRFADGTMHPLWGSAFGALQRVVRPPTGVRLWHDSSQVPFLREDVKDQADISFREAWTIRTLLDAGYDPDAAMAAVVQRDMRLLAGKHSGLYSVQLQRPGAGQDAGRADALPAEVRELLAGRDPFALPAVTEPTPVEEAP